MPGLLSEIGEAMSRSSGLPLPEDKYCPQCKLNQKFVPKDKWSLIPPFYFLFWECSKCGFKKKLSKWDMFK